MAFMVPMACKLSRSEAQEYTDDKQAKAGWYARLSAPGYLDCTEWSGPFATEQEAFEYVCDMYGVDENGDDLEAE